MRPERGYDVAPQPLTWAHVPTLFEALLSFSECHFLPSPQGVGHYGKAQTAPNKSRRGEGYCDYMGMEERWPGVQQWEGGAHSAVVGGRHLVQ